MNLLTRLRIWQNQITHRLKELPVIVLMPHSSCNCRCIMCDIWKANSNKQELSPDHYDPLIKDMIGLNVKEVAFSGGEALLSRNLWTLCDRLKKKQLKLSLLSTGLLLETHADEICRYFDEVIVSLDGDQETHDKIRRIPNAFEKLGNGVRILKKIRPDLRINGRCVIQSANYSKLADIVQSAINLQLDSISFLAADVSSTAFNHPEGFSDQRMQIALSAEECDEFEMIIKKLITEHFQLIKNRYIIESVKKLRGLLDYYRALNHINSFPNVQCNAPWVSIVIEANGSIRPCFFHEEYGNINDRSLKKIINSERALAFRKELDILSDPICQKCVCSLKI